MCTKCKPETLSLLSKLLLYGQQGLHSSEDRSATPPQLGVVTHPCNLQSHTLEVEAGRLV